MANHKPQEPEAETVVVEAPAEAVPVDVPSAPHPIEPAEISERRERIASLRQQIKDAERENRKKTFDADRELTIASLDQQERELEAQLARVRGERPPEE